MQAVREVLQESGIPGKIADIIISAWISGTLKAYNTYGFCTVVKGGQNPLQPTEIAVLLFLTLLFEEGKGYSSLSIAIHLISNFFRGVFNRRPALPRNNVTWDAYMVLNFMKTWALAKRLSLRQLTLKVMVLVLLLSGQRGQTIWLLDTRNITLSKNDVRWRTGDLIKTSNLKAPCGRTCSCCLPS